MLDLRKIDLGKDEAENDENLKRYFLKTNTYKNALSGDKTIIVGRKGSGKSAIFTLLNDEIDSQGNYVIKITPDQYSWSALKDYRESGILPEQAHTNAWKLTLLSSIIWTLNEHKVLEENSKLNKYYKYMKDSFEPKRDNLFLNIVDKIKKILAGIKSEHLSFDFQESTSVATPLKICEELKSLLMKEWNNGKTIRIIIDKIDDSWDSSEDSKHLIVGLLKAHHELNSFLKNKAKITIFIRSDIYDSLFFDDQDKLRQDEETITWDTQELKEIITERIKVSLSINDASEKIWNELFSNKSYRSGAKPEKYVVDRTFKRPRDMISFIRYSIEQAIKNNHSQIEPDDTRLAEELHYSQSKYKDMIIEYQKQMPFIKDLLDSFSGFLHKVTKDKLIKHLEKFIEKRKDYVLNPTVLIRILFLMGFIGIKKYGRAGVRQRGGAAFYFYYDDPSINPLSYDEYYIHQAFRHYLSIKEHRG